MPAPKGNKYALGNNGGRPPKYDNAELLMDRIVEYFTWCEGESHEEEQEIETGKGRSKKTVKVKVTVVDRPEERPTITGLALFLGFMDRMSLYEYAKKEEFTYTIKRALMVIEGEYEQMLPYAKGGGVVFALKNMGWKDESEVKNTTRVTIVDDL